MKKLLLFVAVCLLPFALNAQASNRKNAKQAPAAQPQSAAQQQTQATPERLPIIDIHVHAMKVRDGNSGFLCPWFLEDMPGADPKYASSFSYRKTDCVDPIPAATSTEDLTNQFIETLNRLNITAVCFGDADVLYDWKSKAPDRIIPGISYGSLSVEAFRDSLSNGFYFVMSEVAPQYQGISPSDMSLDAYFAVAEELDMPVGIHMGTGGNGSTNIRGSKMRASMGNPLLLEDLLMRHPNLRVWVQHAGYPMIDELIALMGCNAYVFLDISGLIWSYPLEEIHYTIKRLIQAGFGKRIMYGTDFMSYPKMIEASIGVIQNASYLSEDQKRDILYNNAARFLRLDELKEKL